MAKQSINTILFTAESETRCVSSTYAELYLWPDQSKSKATLHTMLIAASETKVIKNTTYSYTYYVTTIKSTIMYYTNYNMY